MFGSGFSFFLSIKKESAAKEDSTESVEESRNFLVPQVSIYGKIDVKSKKEEDERLMKQKIKWENQAEKLWRRLGGNGSYAGFWLAAYAMARTAEEPELLTYVCKGLYMETAIYGQTSVKCVERNIRTLKERVWRDGDRELLQEIFGEEALKEKAPENRIFIDMLAAYLRRQGKEEDE